MNYLFFLISILFSLTSFGQAGYPDLLRFYNTQKNFNGVVLVATNGTINYLNGAGLSNRQSLTTINSTSKFKIASITKTFTAVLILQLVEEGKLDLGKTIGNYFPDYQGEGKDQVTIENLLTYSSGIPNCESYSGDDIYKKPVTLDSFIANYCSGKLENKPGTKFSYDNGDYVLLGKIIETVTGLSYRENLRKKILDPLSLVNTNLLSSNDIITGLVQSYTFNDTTNVFSAENPYYIENFFAAGAMYSTVEDLLAFDQGIFTYKLLTKKTVDLMLTPHPALDNVGVGFWIADKYGTLNTRFAYRPGGIYGSSANWIHVLDSNKTILAFSNTNATNLFEMSQQLYAISTGQKNTIPVVEKTAGTKANLSFLSGKWLIDLRPTPASEAYTKDFLIKPGDGKFFSGEFYGSSFSNGQFNTDWEYIYFAFTTSDKENTYYHSGYIDGNSMSGTSYSPDRKFISHWTGKKRN